MGLLATKSALVSVLKTWNSCALTWYHNKVQVGKDQEKAQSEKDSHSKNRGGEKTKLTIRYLYHETYRKPNERLFFPIGGHSVTLT